MKLKRATFRRWSLYPGAVLIAGALLAGTARADPPAPDAGAPVKKRKPPRPWPAPLETIQLGAEPASFASPLDAGALYLVRASGALTRGRLPLDAEFGAFGAGGSGAADVVEGTDVGIDVNLKEVLPASGRKPAPPSRKRLKWFGAFRADHVYYLIAPGTGERLRLQWVVPPSAQASPARGTVAVSIYRLSAPTPTMGDPLETVMVPSREKVTVSTALAGARGTVYLLEASGEVQVGGPGHLGDAEFHDYHSDGRGFNEGENGVDFGVGIDEPVIGQGHDPRAHKWGAFRMDHTYFMLYAGTGAPIGLNYHDTGGKSGVFKDNDGILPVRIFPVP